MPLIVPKFQKLTKLVKKGIDFIEEGSSFTNKNAVIDLGVGKNMVTAIRFWLRAFDLVQENKDRSKINLNPFSESLFAENGYDPYCENIGTLWLLHYRLTKRGRASIYSLVFNEFRRTRIEFTDQHLQKFLVRKCALDDYQYNENTIKRDIRVFVQNYVPSDRANNVEDNFSGLLNELGIVEKIGKIGKEREKWYRIENTERPDLPPLIVLYAILDNDNYGDSVRFDELLTGKDSVGSIFALNTDALLSKIEAFQQIYPDIVYTDDGGIRLLQFKQRPSKEAVLARYYGN